MQDPALRLSLVQSVCMATQAVCSSAHGGSFHLSRKAELVAQMVVRVGGLGRAEPLETGQGARGSPRPPSVLTTYLTPISPTWTLSL